MKPAPVPAPSAHHTQQLIRLYGWAAPKLGALTVRITTPRPGHTAVLLLGSASPAAIVIGTGPDATAALADAARRSRTVSRAFLQVPAPPA